ncbi:MAG: glutamate synthase large subunit [Planctomycetota bacterium]|nr:glutamate synthase large subunit [Planctomycetota bacterium]
MKKIGLYDPAFEHDACGVGFVCRLDGRESREVVRLGLSALCNLSHRGAAGADSDTGDGAGIIAGIPDAFFRRSVDFPLPEAGGYGVGMLFLPPGEEGKSLIASLERTAAAEGWRLLGWRTVPVRPEQLGRAAAAVRPDIRQVFVAPVRGDDPSPDGMERGLYVLRKRIEAAAARDPDRFYIPSLSSRVVVYKGMMHAAQVEKFYRDLGEDDFASTFTILHQRYSTNTFPSWRVAQPMRWLAHNGEINTLRGNRNWLEARSGLLASPLFGGDIAKIHPVLDPDTSDSASLDNAFELLNRGGRGLDHVMAMLIPQAWGAKYPMGPDLRGFFEFHAGLMEPWDGPAAVVFTDGIRVGACLDRNGLRPARYSITGGGLMVFASETGVVDLPASEVTEKGALRPGQMLVADIGNGRLIDDYAAKIRLARRRPYRRWVKENRLEIPGFLGAPAEMTVNSGALPFRQRLFGYTRDDLDILLDPMAAKGSEPVGSMGADLPLAVLSPRPQMLFSYFRQQFAQITNPAMDSIREELVMSIMTFIGNHPNILEESPAQARLLKLTRPVLSNEDMAKLHELAIPDFRCVTLDAVFDPPSGRDRPGEALERGLARLEREAHDAARAGAKIIVLSDKHAGPDRLPIPSILTVAAVNQRLLGDGSRVSIGLVCECGDAREVAHMALIFGMGASAVNPWLAFDTVVNLAARRELSESVSPSTALENYIHAMDKGLLKIMSKMGISTLRGYRGAKAFEAVGLGQELMDRYFPGIPSRVGGIGLGRIEHDALARLEEARPFWLNRDSRKTTVRRQVETVPQAADLEIPLPAGGVYRYRRDGERHLWTPDTITLLQRAVRTGDQGAYREYAERINNQAREAFTLRGLLSFKPAAVPVPLEEVEPEEAIMRRFVTGAMSFGSISDRAHETLARAMNSLGGRSNSGEGGEDPGRYPRDPDGGWRRSATKQVASGRFGVTIEYLVNADELQIKIAQGAKPGEGGQLPGHKVDRDIARVRHSTPGVTLISPPPHHDIYSIEDIAQLIYDLKRANKAAKVSVKLVSEVGVGTIAAGAAKAGADLVLISGHDGGTGASPLSSIRHAGSPWEIGLAESQQTLSLNGLRGRIRLQADGQLKTGRDVAIAALFGADEFGFATAALVSMGCLMMRKCHTNGCPVGIATQDRRLISRFAGKPEHVVNFFRFVSREAREIMAGLGFRTFREMVGRVDRLEMNGEAGVWRERGLDFGRLLYRPEGDALRHEPEKAGAARPESELEKLFLPRVETCLETGRPVEVSAAVANTDRAVGARASGLIAAARGAAGLEEDTVVLRLTGTAGQSFGAFGARGLTLELTGEANDYVGKGLSGAKIIVRTPRDAGYPEGDSMIAGNVCLYGATSGEVYLNGRAGERFAVRNSGATAVVEGVGDHGCEYMTGGRVAVLGTTGMNFAGGMSGGIAYVYDVDGLFDNRCNLEMVDLDIMDDGDERDLQRLLQRHYLFTGSTAARRILDNWEREKTRFVKVFPMEYRRVLGEMLKTDAETPRPENESA